MRRGFFINELPVGFDFIPVQQPLVVSRLLKFKL